MRTAQKNVKNHNLKGDGLTMGGEMVVTTGGKVAYAHPEKTFGDHAPVNEVRRNLLHGTGVPACFW